MLGYQYNRLPIQTRTEKDISALMPCENCAAAGVESHDHYVHLGCNHNPQRMDGYIGETWQIRCRRCDYAVSPELRVTAEEVAERRKLAALHQSA